MITSVSFSREMVVVVVEQLLAKILVVGQLAVEGEAEPLVLLDMVPLEGLGVAAVVLTAGGVADVPDRRSAGVLVHQALEFAPVVEPEDLANVADVFVGVD